MLDAAHLRALTAAANRHDVYLPDTLRNALASVAGLPTVSSTVQTEAAAVLAALSSEDPKALAKRLTAAGNRLAAATAERELLSLVNRQSDGHLWALARRDREAIAAAFAPAVAEPLAVLTAHAPRLPAALTESEVPDLNPEAFAGWRACTAALGTLADVWAGLAALYISVDRDAFPPASVMMLAFADPGQHDDPTAATKAYRAIEGRVASALRSTVTTVEGFGPSAIVAAGGRFAFAGPADAAQRQRRLLDECTISTALVWA